jgi:hypothetical protein
MKIDPLTVQDAHELADYMEKLGWTPERQHAALYTIMYALIQSTERLSQETASEAPEAVTMMGRTFIDPKNKSKH